MITPYNYRALVEFLKYLDEELCRSTTTTTPDDPKDETAPPPLRCTGPTGLVLMTFVMGVLAGVFVPPRVLDGGTSDAVPRAEAQRRRVAAEDAARMALLSWLMLPPVPAPVNSPSADPVRQMTVSLTDGPTRCVVRMGGR